MQYGLPRGVRQPGRAGIANNGVGQSSRAGLGSMSRFKPGNKMH